MRVIPEATILEPVDNVMLKDLLLKVKDLTAYSIYGCCAKNP